MRKHKFGHKEILLMACSSIFFLSVCDMILKRLLPPVYKTAKYGGPVIGHITHKITVEDSPGRFRDITVKYYQDGFKRWGAINTKKTKMLLIGDSITQMPFVSNGEEWYSYLEKEFENLELFVFGGGGYGSLQEYLILDDVIDKIHPHLILIQFFGNDYANNLYDLDLMDYPYNNHVVRPYLENDRIVYRLPLPFEQIRRNSFVADRILAIYDKAVWKRATKDLAVYSKKRQLAALKMSLAEKQKIERIQKKAVSVTNRIYEMIRKRTEGLPVYLFNCNDDPVVEEICRVNGFKCISGITGELTAKEKEGFHTMIVNDGHWNKLGNQLVGQKMVEYFKQVEPPGFAAWATPNSRPGAQGSLLKQKD